MTREWRMALPLHSKDGWDQVLTIATGAREADRAPAAVTSRALSVIVQDPGWLDYPGQAVFGTTRTTQDTLYVANGANNNDKGNSNVIAWHVDSDAHH